MSKMLLALRRQSPSCHRERMDSPDLPEFCRIAKIKPWERADYSGTRPLRMPDPLATTNVGHRAFRDADLPKPRMLDRIERIRSILATCAAAPMTLPDAAEKLSDQRPAIDGVPNTGNAAIRKNSLCRRTPSGKRAFVTRWARLKHRGLERSAFYSRTLLMTGGSRRRTTLERYRSGVAEAAVCLRRLGRPSHDGKDQEV